VGVRLLVVAVAALVAGCRAHTHDFGIPVKPTHVQLTPQRLEVLLRAEPLPVRAVRSATGGTSGAELAWLDFPSEGMVIRAKWKAAPHRGERLNNVPRKELAAYAIQKLFLAPDEYVVPVTVARCLPTAFHDSRFGHARAFDDTRCVLGIVSDWIEDATNDNLRDWRRFARDPAYARTIANLNLLTYVIDHRDTRKANFILTKPGRPPRAYAVDNGLAFSGIRNPLAWFVPDWSHLLVPSVPRDTVARLRTLDRAALDRLAVVAQFRRSADGGLEEIAPTAPTDERHGVRVTGDIVQLGLTRKEIDAIERRIRALLVRVDAGDLPLF